MLEHLYQVQVVLGVLTAEIIANVYYELGIAHATQPLSWQALVAEEDHQPQFDTKDLIFMQLDPGDLAVSVDSLDEAVEPTDRNPRECI